GEKARGDHRGVGDSHSRHSGPITASAKDLPELSFLQQSYGTLAAATTLTVASLPTVTTYRLPSRKIAFSPRLNPPSKASGGNKTPDNADIAATSPTWLVPFTLPCAFAGCLFTVLVSKLHSLSPNAVSGARGTRVISAATTSALLHV